MEYFRNYQSSPHPNLQTRLLLNMQYLNASVFSMLLYIKWKWNPKRQENEKGGRIRFQFVIYRSANFLKCEWDFEQPRVARWLGLILRKASLQFCVAYWVKISPCKVSLYIIRYICICASGDEESSWALGSHAKWETYFFLYSVSVYVGYKWASISNPHFNIF